MGCTSAKQKGVKQERDKVLKEGSEVIVQMQKSMKEMLEQNLEYGKKIAEMRNQLKQLTVQLDEKQAKLTTQNSTLEKFNISDKEEVAVVQREIRELKQQTEAAEEKYSKNEITLQQVQIQLENVAQKVGGDYHTTNQNGYSNEQKIQSSQGNYQQLSQKVYNNERNLQVQEQEMNKKIENLSSQMNKVQTASTINKKDTDNLLEIVQTQQQLLQEEVLKQKLLNQQVVEIESQLRMSKEFQLIQQFQIEKLSKMLIEQRNLSQSGSVKGRQNDTNGISLSECIDSQKKRHLNDLNLIHKQHGFQWSDWRELEEYKWLLTQDNKYAHEFEVKQNSGTAAAADQNSIKQKIICNICYTQYISMNKVFTQLQLNQGISSNY